MSVIVLTAGHSATDPGAVAADFTEAEIALELRDLTAELLRSMGHVVIEDGADGDNLPLRYAISLIGQGAIAVELHLNASDNPSAHGVEAISLPPHRAVARQLAQRVASALRTRVRGDSGWIDQSQSARGRLGYVNGGGVILETFFLTNPTERERYLANPRAVAEAIADVLDEVAT